MNMLQKLLGKNGPVVIVAVVAVAAIVAVVLVVTGDDNVQPAPQSGADDTGAESQSPADTMPESGQTPPADSGSATNDQETDTSEDAGNQTLTPAPHLDARLPDNWDQLSSREKTDANPHGCHEESIIRADNGRCVVPGTSINYVPMIQQGPHSYLPGLVGFQGVTHYVGVPDNASDADMDQFFEHFRPRWIQPEYLGIPADLLLTRLEVYYYSDFEFVDDAWGGIDIDHGNARRIYLIHPRHYFRVTDFGGYGVSSGEDRVSRVYEDGREGLLPEGCKAAVDVTLVYRSGEMDIADGEDEPDVDVVYYYGPSSPPAADFREAIVGGQGELHPEFRSEILMSLGLVGIDEMPDDQYDILLKFYRYNSDKGDDFGSYDTNDVFMPDIHVVECSGN